MMQRVNNILQHPEFIRRQNELEQLESERIFCNHERQHLMDVGRISYILSLEEGQNVPKSVIYACALLHDIGRGEQYTNGTPHDEAGVKIAGPILEDCGFTSCEIRDILAAIGAHRGASGGRLMDVNGTEKADHYSRATILADLLYRADKKSRLCFQCSAEPECNWSQEKKNLTWEY